MVSARLSYFDRTASFGPGDSFSFALDWAPPPALPPWVTPESRQVRAVSLGFWSDGAVRRRRVRGPSGTLA